MIHNIVENNVNGALETGLRLLRAAGVRAPSRNGPVLVAPGPVITEYRYPQERVLFNAVRDANPFFHLFESLWMLAGRQDVDYVAQFASRMREYSDDGLVLHGAYGHRWRRWFGYDQLQIIIDELKDNPTSRRCVLTMWDAGGWEDSNRELSSDLMTATHGGRDVPCNTHAYFQVIDTALHLTVCCRSNDMVWGAHGANAVHFSMLQEYMAAHIGVAVGRLYQVSNNYHLYTDLYNLQTRPELVPADDRYDGRKMVHFLPLIVDPARWDAELDKFMEQPIYDYAEPFFKRVALPLWTAWHAYKLGKNDAALLILKSEQLDQRDPGIDWHVAAIEWIQRRIDKEKSA
jgi:hypothetical protein